MQFTHSLYCKSAKMNRPEFNLTLKLLLKRLLLKRKAHNQTYPDENEVEPKSKAKSVHAVSSFSLNCSVELDLLKF